MVHELQLDDELAKPNLDRQGIREHCTEVEKAMHQGMAEAQP
jgi:hypothetical protein